MYYLDKSYETTYARGAAMMCKKEDLKTIGLMSESYFLYYEKLDWCERFKKAGRKIWFTGKAKIYHKESISVGKESSLKTYFMHRNRMLIIRKNSNLLTTVLFRSYFLLIACPKSIIKYFLIGRNDLIPWVIRAVNCNLTNSKDSMFLGYKFEQR